MSPARVAVVGAGIAGAACAAALAGGGIEVSLLDRGRAPGGRLASPELHGRRTDLGAAYFTVRDEQFGAVVADWTARGLVRPWTDTVAVLSPDGHERKAGPVRHAAPGGLRSLVRDLLPEDATAGREVASLSELDHDAVVLAMPDPQAARVLRTRRGSLGRLRAGDRGRRRLARAVWEDLEAAFVNNDPDITLIADDGARRGDGAPVLVVHTTAERARRHLGAPQRPSSRRCGRSPAYCALTRRRGGPTPIGGRRQARGDTRRGAFALLDAMAAVDSHDSWCPSGRPGWRRRGCPDTASAGRSPATRVGL